MTGYMRDWLERPGEPASDLDLVVLLLNSLDLLADPADRLAGLDWLREVLAAVIYPVFWTLGVVKMVASRRVKPSVGQQAPPLCSVDRDQAVQTLGAALAQGRLTEDEHGARAAQVSATRSRAELAALTADLPADLTARLPTARDAWTGVCVSIAAVGVLAALILWHPDNFLAFVAALSAAATVLLAPPITLGLMVDARYQKRSGRSVVS